MKSFLLSLLLLSSSQGFTQVNMSKDSIVSILLVSHYHSFDIPIIRNLKLNRDIIYFLNIKDQEMFGFIDANYDLYGVIENFYLDSLGLLRIHLDLSDVSSGKLVKRDITIEHKVGSSYFTILEGKKRIRHTEITCEFHDEKLFNVDLP